MKRIQITEDEYKEIKAQEAKTKDKNISRRLKVLILWYEGKTLKEIGEKLDLHPMSVTEMKYSVHWRLLLIDCVRPFVI